MYLSMCVCVSLSMSGPCSVHMRVPAVPAPFCLCHLINDYELSCEHMCVYVCVYVMQHVQQ